MPAWPAALPALEIEGYRESPPNVVIRTQMDAGPPKTRRRNTANVRSISGVVTLTPAQLDTFNAFHDTDCAGGALPFDWVHPRTGAARSICFAQLPEWVFVEGYYRIALSLALLP